MTLIIAEAGVNHNGDIATAKQLIDVAANAGVDFVKFQTFKADKLVTKTAERAEYQKENTGKQDSQYQMLEKLELSEADHHTLQEYAQQKGVEFLSTGFDLDSLEFLSNIGITLGKIPSGELTNYPYLVKIAELYSDVILSTGLATMQEVKEAYDVLVKNRVNPERLRVSFDENGMVGANQSYNG